MMRGSAEPSSKTTTPVISGGRLQWREALFAPPAAKRACVLVPAEKVLLVVVDLPLASQRQRLEAVPFAVEGMIAEPLSKVHIVLGPPVGPKRYLAAIVSHAVMAEWSEILSKGGLSTARLLPDVLTMPRPEAGGWTVLCEDGRALVRKGDGAGFGLGLASLGAAWRLAGSPSIVSYGDALPAEMLAQSGEASAVVPVDPAIAGFDLRQGAYAGRSSQASSFLRQAAWIAGVGAILLGAIHVADTFALRSLADERQNAARKLLARSFPDIVPDEDISAALGRLLPDEGVAVRGTFLPLLSRIGEALNPQADGLTVQSMDYDADDGELGMEVAAENLAALQRIEAAMTGAGLQASSGVATAEGGAAEVRIVVRDDGAGASR